MIEPLTDLPAGVLGFRASGRVTGTDYEAVLMPAIDERLRESKSVRLLYQIGPGFTGFTAGAMWDDAKLGLKRLTAWERVAVVTDVEWIASAVKLFAFVMPGAVKVFSHADYPRAIDWLTAAAV